MLDKQVIIRSGASIGNDFEMDRRRGCTISEWGIVVIARGVDIAQVQEALAIVEVIGIIGISIVI